MLLAATVWSFAHLQQGISNRNKVVWLTAKRKGCCYNLSVGVTFKVRFTANGLWAKSNTQIYVVQTNNDRVILSGDLYCCLLPYCEALRTCHSSIFDRNVRNIILPCLGMVNTWKWPETTMHWELDSSLGTFRYVDELGYNHFCSTRFGLKMMVFFWTSSELSVWFWDCSILCWY